MTLDGEIFDWPRGPGFQYWKKKSRYLGPEKSNLIRTMNQTIAEKTISSHCGHAAYAGETVVASIDLAMATDGSGPLAIELFDTARAYQRKFRRLHSWPAKPVHRSTLRRWRRSSFWR